jgi:viroplasmin and RNaseH domain-containing protein
MSKSLEYLVNWTGRVGHERYSTFDTLEEAQAFFEELKARDYDHYVYLSVVIAQS